MRSYRTQHDDLRPCIRLFSLLALLNARRPRLTRCDSCCHLRRVADFFDIDFGLWCQPPHAQHHLAAALPQCHTDQTSHLDPAQQLAAHVLQSHARRRLARRRLTVACAAAVRLQRVARQAAVRRSGREATARESHVTSPWWRSMVEGVVTSPAISTASLADDSPGSPPLRLVGGVSAEQVLPCYVTSSAPAASTATHCAMDCAASGSVAQGDGDTGSDAVAPIVAATSTANASVATSFKSPLLQRLVRPRWATG